MTDHQPVQPIIDWLAEKIATHGPTAVTGTLGGMVAALRSAQHQKLWTIIKLGIVGGIFAPFAGVAMREFGVSEQMRYSGVFIAGVFSLEILDLIGDAIKAARVALVKRVDREINPE